MLYFAYGSNLNLHQMAQRCPAAEPHRRLLLPDARLVFRGVADVIYEEGHKCPGGLWRITEECEEALDRYEGFNPERPDHGMYSKDYVWVDGIDEEIMLYTMNSSGIMPPSVSYYNGIKQGYQDFGLKLKPLIAALKHSYDDKAPSYIERRRTRRMGRPTLAPYPEKPKTSASRPRRAGTRADVGDPSDGVGIRHQPEQKYSRFIDDVTEGKLRNLDDWLRERRERRR